MSNERLKNHKKQYLWEYYNGRWHCKNHEKTVNKSIANERIAQLTKRMISFDDYSKALGSHAFVDNFWNHQSTLELFRIITIVGTHWMVVHDRMKDYFSNNKLAECRRYTSIHDCSVTLRLLVEPSCYQVDLSEDNSFIKERYYTILNQLLPSGSKYTFSAAEAQENEKIAKEKYSVDLSNYNETIQELILNLQKIANNAIIEPNNIDLKLRKNNALFNQVCANSDLSKIGYPQLFEFCPLENVLKTFYKSKSLFLVSSLKNNIYENVFLSLKALSKHALLLSAGREYQQAVDKIITSAKANVSAEFFSDDWVYLTLDDIKQENNLYKVMSNINSWEAFKCYTETVYEACIYANLEKYLRNVSQMIASWSSKLQDMRRSLRATKKYVKGSQNTVEKND